MSPIAIFWALTIGAVCGNLLQSYGSTRSRIGKCLEDNLGAMQKVALGDLLRDLPGEKGGRSDAKIGSIRSKGSLDSERGHFKHIGQCPAPQGATVSTKGMKSLSRRMRSFNVYVGL